MTTTPDEEFDPANIHTTELGHPGGITTSYSPLNNQRRYEVTSPEDWAPELRFPESIVVFDTMRREAQLTGVLEAIAQPINGAEWQLITDGVPDNVVEFVRTELGLATVDSPLARTYHNGINIVDHIEEMVETMLWAGFACAEMVYNTGPATPAQAGLGAGFNGEVRHLRKLATRPPRTITKIETERDGGLKAVYQKPVDYEGGDIEDTPIDVSALVFYSHKRKGGLWQGESALLGAYRPWALKDIYLRLDAAAVDKHSSGYWVGKSRDQQRADTLFMQLAELRNGERAALVLDPDDEVNLVGMSGSMVDITPRLNFLNQEMSKSALAMFMELGHDAGARSLGDTFLSVFMNKVASVAKYVGRVITEHVIRDLVRHNYPAGTPYPILTPGDIVAQQGASAETVKALMDSGALTYDAGLERYLRARHGLPPLPTVEDGEETDVDTDTTDRALAEATIRKLNTDAAATAYRSGFDALSIAAAYDLPGALRHSGLLPVTVKTEEAIVNEGATGPRAIAASEHMTAVQRATAAYNALMERVGESVVR